MTSISYLENFAAKVHANGGVIDLGTLLDAATEIASKPGTYGETASRVVRALAAIICEELIECDDAPFDYGDDFRIE